MNKTLTPTSATVNADIWFSQYLQKKLLETGMSMYKLGAAVGCERKALFAYIHLERSPKLDLVAKVLSYFGESEIRIPIGGKK